jgi:hypothetical protein
MRPVIRIKVRKIGGQWSKPWELIPPELHRKGPRKAVFTRDLDAVLVQLEFELPPEQQEPA